MKKQIHINNQKYIFSFSFIALLLILGVVFYIITAMLKNVSEGPTHKDFLLTEGQFSRLSSNLGMDVMIDPAKNISNNYIIEWQISGGKLLQWSKDKKQWNEILQKHKKYPMTTLKDGNYGGVIWAPINIDKKSKLVLKAYLYKSKKSKKPLYYDKITLKSTNGVTYQIETKKPNPSKIPSIRK